MYAFHHEQLKSIADLAAATNEGALKGDLYAKIEIQDLNDNIVVGWLGFDDNGVYGFMPNSEVVANKPEDFA